MTETASQRLRRIERMLRNGKVPIILNPTPGVEPLLRAYGLEPNVDIVVPMPGESSEDVQKRRAILRAQRQYKRERKLTGHYLEPEERLRKRADKGLRAWSRLLDKFNGL